VQSSSSQFHDFRPTLQSSKVVYVPLVLLGILVLLVLLGILVLLVLLFLLVFLLLLVLLVLLIHLVLLCILLNQESESRRNNTALANILKCTFLLPLNTNLFTF